MRFQTNKLQRTARMQDVSFSKCVLIGIVNLPASPMLKLVIQCALWPHRQWLTSTTSPTSSMASSKMSKSKADEKLAPSRGFVSDAGGGPPRSTIQKCLAMFQEAQRLRQRIQQVWQLGALRCARSSSELCSKHVSGSHPSANDGPNGGAEGHGHASDRLEGQTATLRAVQENHREGRGGQQAVQLHTPRDLFKDEHDVPASFDTISPGSQGIHATTSGGRCADSAPCGDTTCPQRCGDPGDRSGSGPACPGHRCRRCQPRKSKSWPRGWAIWQIPMPSRQATIGWEFGHQQSGQSRGSYGSIDGLAIEPQLSKFDHRARSSLNLGSLLFSYIIFDIDRHAPKNSWTVSGSIWQMALTLTKPPPMKQSALCIGSSVQDGFGLACSAQSGAHGMRWTMTAWGARLSWKLVVCESAWLFVVWWIGWFVMSFTTPQCMCFGNGLLIAWIGRKKLFSVLKTLSFEEDVIGFVAALMDAGMEWWAHRPTSLACCSTRDGSSSLPALCSIASTRPRFALAITHTLSFREKTQLFQNIIHQRWQLPSLMLGRNSSFLRARSTSFSWWTAQLKTVCVLTPEPSSSGHYLVNLFLMMKTLFMVIRHHPLPSGVRWVMVAGKRHLAILQQSCMMEGTIIWAHAQGGRAVGRAVAEDSQSFRTPQQPKPCQDHQRSWKARVASATCPPTSLLSMWSCETWRLILRKGATGGNELASQGLVHCLDWHWRVDYDGAKTEVEVHDGDRLPLGFDLEGCPSRGSATCGRWRHQQWPDLVYTKWSPEEQGTHSAPGLSALRFAQARVSKRRYLTLPWPCRISGGLKGWIFRRLFSRLKRTKSLNLCGHKVLVSYVKLLEFQMVICCKCSKIFMALPPLHVDPGAISIATCRNLELAKSWAILVCGYGHNQIHALSIPWTSTMSSASAIWQVTWMVSIEVAMMKIHLGSRSRMRSTSFIDEEQQRQVSIDMSAVTLRWSKAPVTITSRSTKTVETLMHLEIDGQRFAQPDLALSKRKLANVEQPLLLCSG